ncbi:MULTISPECIES: hypothetical protein [Bacillaceae]|uniref:hypothetical protein n=1 Tax=Bacillaceae TaxID=186817 RepID=UPI000BEC64DB|nr:MULTISPECIES: hypothetical protein [unclassified Bacillus (in: firmicutes)]PEC51448.1 hypothetical protein CON00_02160 [Bacillus sp. AFS096315]PFM78756.1 hypothetical protein COJ46_17090 [Bacillus sp. AFS077874]
MSSHIIIATMKRIEDLKYVFERHILNISSGEEYSIDLPLTLPYVYEIFGYEKLSFISFLEEFMELGDIVEVYEYCDGKELLPESINNPNEARTINLLQLTYKDELGEYQFDERNWMNELTTRRVVSKRSVTTFMKY